MKNKWIVLIAILTMGIIVGIFAAVNAGGKTNVSQPNAPVAPATPAVLTPVGPTPVQTPPVATNEPAPAGVIEITAEKLVRDLLSNPNKYREGTVMQVSGTVLKFSPFDGTYLGPMIKTSSGARLSVSLIIDPLTLEGQRLFNKLKEEDCVVIRGEFVHFNPADLGGVLVKNISIVSVTPVK